jgi:replicative DNA helicase
MVNTDLEQLVIAQALANPLGAGDVVAQSLTIDCFTVPENQCIFKAIQKSKAEGKEGSINDILPELKQTSPQTDLYKLFKLTDIVVTTSNIEGDCQTLTDNFNSRRLVKYLADKIIDIQLSGQPYSDAAEILDSLKNYLPSSESNSDSRARMHRLASRIKSGMEGKTPELIRTGLSTLDRVLAGGLEPGTLTVIAGRPGMGKTALITTILFNQIKNGLQSGMVSMEMTEDQMARREAAMITGIPYNRMKDMGRITHPEYEAIAKAAIDQTKLIELESCGMVDLPRLRKIVFDLATRRGCKLIAIDYLQRMDIEVGRGQNEASAIGSIVNAIKSMAKNLNVPIILLSQLGREVEKRADKRPMMSDLRGSGMIEEAADAIVLMYREAYYNNECQEPNICELQIEKNRDGDAGMYVKVGCDIGVNRFYDLNSNPLADAEF